MAMKKRVLGRTNIQVSEISFGTVSLGIPYGIGINSAEDMLSELEAIELLKSALDKGINFFDTARIYGSSEELIGKAFKERRQDVVICTKCAHLYDKNRQLLPEGEWEEFIDNSLKESLSALQTDYVDIYMLHTTSLKTLSHPTIVKAFSGCMQKGMARAIGVSTYTVEETKKAIESKVWDVVQLPYSLMDQRQGELFDMAREYGVGIVVRSVLFKGILTDRGRDLHPKLEAVQKHRQVYNELLNEKTPTLSDLATKFVLSQREVSSVLLGIDRPEYLDKAIQAGDSGCLDEETIARAKQRAYPEPEFLDLGKWAAMGWL